MKFDIQPRLSRLRAAMSAAGVDAVIIPQTDPHQSEYLADHWQVRRYFSNFTGSAGDLIVTSDCALLWTDSRYFLQAADQLKGSEIILMKDGLPDTPSQAQWLCDNLRKGATVGVDTKVISAVAYEDLTHRLARKDIHVVNFDAADVWEERPELPGAPVFVHDIKYAGVGAKEKLQTALAKASDDYDADAVFISALDEIAWLLNIRSRDVKYNPVATAFLFVDREKSTLFINPAKLTDQTRDYLAREGVETAPYSGVSDFIAALPVDKRVLIETGRNARYFFDVLGKRAVAGSSVVAIDKACKNDIQIAGIHAAMERDGVALVKSFMEIERRMAVDEPTTELDVADILHHYRSEQPLYFDESFGTIAGYGPHGAIVHYEATAETSSVIKTGNLLLIDSGAQYLDGTTDITRTISIGAPTGAQRRDFTLVMKGHIALAKAIFPEGTTGHQLDALARMYLWKNGLNYLHGTGHGVGHFLGVHEGPQSIRLNHVPTPLKPGMVTSNEPGLYRENIHGIRCENLVLTVNAMTTEFGNFLRFETLTLCPFDLTLFDTSIMTDEEIDWVNNYHTLVRSRLTPLLNSAERTWLERKTQPLTK
ncbi:MAG: aminopeptidase P family protein [Muribaculaceae bacterium]|nr:aminopeptidase P family protein [Muribaculaceae bacterium]